MGHDEPLEPIISIDNTIEKSGLSRAERALVAYRTTKQYGLSSKDTIKIICEKMQLMILPLEAESDEKALSLLRSEDIQNVERALQSVYSLI